MDQNLSRRDLLRTVALGTAALALPMPLAACRREDPDHARLSAWVAALRAQRPSGGPASLGRDAIRVGELAAGTPYEPYTLEAYLRSGGSPAHEPLTLSLTRFDCVTLVESCLAVARLA